MRAGDLISIDGERWLCGRVDGDTCLVLDWQGSSMVVAADLDRQQPDRCQLVACPYLDWPYVIFSLPKVELVSSVCRPEKTGDLVEQVPFYDWVVGEPLRRICTLYLNPLLKLAYKESLVVYTEPSNSSIRVDIPRNFGTIQRRLEIHKEKTAPKEAPSVYDRLLTNCMEEDEDT